MAAGQVHSPEDRLPRTLRGGTCSCSRESPTNCKGGGSGETRRVRTWSVCTKTVANTIAAQHDPTIIHRWRQPHILTFNPSILQITLLAKKLSLHGTQGHKDESTSPEVRLVVEPSSSLPVEELTTAEHGKVKGDVHLLKSIQDIVTHPCLCEVALQKPVSPCLAVFGAHTWMTPKDAPRQLWLQTLWALQLPSSSASSSSRTWSHPNPRAVVRP